MRVLSSRNLYVALRQPPTYRLPVFNEETLSMSRNSYEPDGFYLPHTDSLHVEDLQKESKRKKYQHLDGFVVEGEYPHSARYFTGLCHLSDDFGGGQTIFPLYDENKKQPPTKGRFMGMQNSNSEQTMSNWEQLLPDICDGLSMDGMSIPSEKDSSVLFYNHFIDENGLVGQLDRQSLHAGCTVRGEHESG